MTRTYSPFLYFLNRLLFSVYIHLSINFVIRCSTEEQGGSLLVSFLSWRRENERMLAEKSRFFKELDDSEEEMENMRREKEREKD